MKEQGLRPILKATALLSGSSLVTIGIGLISSKLLALMLGPSGFGFIGLLQSLLAILTLIMGMGISVAVVRSGANALEERDLYRVAAIRRAAWALIAASGGVGLLCLVLGRVRISYWALDSASYSKDVVLLGVALMFSLAGGLQIGILNAYHRVDLLAGVAAIGSAVGTMAMLPFVWFWGRAGVTPAIICSSAIAWFTPYYFMRRIGSPEETPTGRDVARAALPLLKFGSAYTASMLVGSGVQMVMPMLVLRTLGVESVGHYRAAISVSFNYLGFLLTAMAQDYYPRISAAMNDPTKLVTLVNQQFRLIMLIAVPIILISLAIVPYLVPLIYSDQFRPASALLEWQLIGDLAKFASWTMSYVILVRCSGVVYFLTELSAGASMLLGSWLGMKLFGLPGLGLAFLASYVFYCAVVWAVTRRNIPLVFTGTNKRMILAAACVAIVIRAIPITPLAALRTPIALLAAIVSGIVSLYLIRREIGHLGENRWTTSVHKCIAALTTRRA